MDTRQFRYPASGVRWPRDEALDAMIAAEELRSVRRYGGSRDDLVRATFGSPVLLTAPHAVAHWRAGTRKPADMGTGFIVDAVAEECGASTLVAEGEQSGDGNFDPTSLFRTRLGGLLPGTRVVVDVHGMSDRYGMDVCLGTGGNPDLSGRCVQVLRGRLEAVGFTVSVDDPYDAAKTATVTRAVHAAGVPGVQVELSRRVRRHLDDPEPCLLLIQTLADAVLELAAGTVPAGG